MSTPSMVLPYSDDEGSDEEVSIPCVWAVCYRCQGDGKHTNPSIDGNGLPQEYAEDMDFMEEYLGGMYDVTCYECKGARVVAEPVEVLTDKQRKALESHYNYQRELADEQRMRDRGIEF